MYSFPLSFNKHEARLWSNDKLTSKENSVASESILLFVSIEFPKNLLISWGEVITMCYDMTSYSSEIGLDEFIFSDCCFCISAKLLHKTLAYKWIVVCRVSAVINNRDCSALFSHIRHADNKLLANAKFN